MPVEYLRRLEKTWNALSPGDLDMGARAYPGYHQTLRGLATHYGFGFVQTVEAFVALSPANDYHSNLRSLVSVMLGIKNGLPPDAVTITTFRRCGERARAYLLGEISFLDTVKGSKITAFRHNILYPDTSPRVTVDGHMVCLYVGHNMTMKEANFELRKYGYEGIEADYRTLFRRNKVKPPVGQAALWYHRKRVQAIKFDGQADLFSGATGWDRPLTPEEILPIEASPRRA